MWKAPETARGWDTGCWRLSPPFPLPQGCHDASHSLDLQPPNRLPPPGSRRFVVGSQRTHPGLQAKLGPLRINVVLGFSLRFFTVVQPHQE